MRQYEIRWAELSAPVGRRPVLLLTRTAAYEYREIERALGHALDRAELETL